MSDERLLVYVDLEGDYSAEVEGVRATCSRCGHETESFGTSGASVRRCLVLLREECPRAAIGCASAFAVMLRRDAGERQGLRVRIRCDAPARPEGAKRVRLVES